MYDPAAHADVSILELLMLNLRPTWVQECLETHEDDIICPAPGSERAENGAYLALEQARKAETCIRARTHTLMARMCCHTSVYSLIRWNSC